jgi:LAS superfamily LD-carboxypeptidase LdcB
LSKPTVDKNFSQKNTNFRYVFWETNGGRTMEVKRRNTLFAFAAALLFILLGSANAYAPDIVNQWQEPAVAGNERADSNNPKLIIDGETIDLGSLLNSEIPLHNGQASGVLQGSTVEINSQEKRLHIILNDSAISMQFMNTAVDKTESSFRLRPSNLAQAALVITAPQVDVIANSQVDLITEGPGEKQVCFIMDLKDQNGKIAIGNMRRVSFPGKIAGFVFLVNDQNRLGENYIPENLIPIPREVQANQSKADMQLVEEAVNGLAKMMEQAKRDGVGGFILTSTYRPYSYQSMLFNRKIKQVGSEEKAAQIVARPGTSEHQSGLAIDFSTNGTLSDNFANTPQGNWLRQNAWKYGFILRYPADKTGITKIIYEPWHYRYVGYPYSKIMYDRNICLEEFYTNMNKYGFYAVADSNHVYLAILNQRDQKIYLSEPVPRG